MIGALLMKTLLVAIVLWQASPTLEWKDTQKNYPTEAACIEARDKLLDSQGGKTFGVIARCAERKR